VIRASRLVGAALAVSCGDRSEPASRACRAPNGCRPDGESVRLRSITGTAAQSAATKEGA
jgi:hypothetical protein